MNRRLPVMVLTLAFVAAAGFACRPGDSSSTTSAGNQSSTTKPGTTTAPGTTPPASTSAPVPTAGAADQQASVDAAKAKLAARLGIGVSAITVASIEAVSWPDTSLGVPESGKMYAQVITPGYKIVLSASGTQYEYHTGGSGPSLNVVAKN